MLLRRFSALPARSTIRLRRAGARSVSEAVRAAERRRQHRRRRAATCSSTADLKAALHRGSVRERVTSTSIRATTRTAEQVTSISVSTTAFRDNRTNRFRFPRPPPELYPSGSMLLRVKRRQRRNTINYSSKSAILQAHCWQHWRLTAT